MSRPPLSLALVISLFCYFHWGNWFTLNELVKIQAEEEGQNKVNTRGLLLNSKSIMGAKRREKRKRGKIQTMGKQKWGIWLETKVANNRSHDNSSAGTRQVKISTAAGHHSSEILNHLMVQIV